MKSRKPPQAPALPSLCDIGRTIVALSAEHTRQDEVTLRARDAAHGSAAHERYSRAQAAMRVLFWQEDALVDLGLALVPETLADAVAQLALVDRRIDEALASDESIEGFRTIARACLHAVRASLPVIAGAADIGLDDIAKRMRPEQLGADGGHQTVTAQIINLAERRAVRVVRPRYRDNDKQATTMALLNQIMRNLGIDPNEPPCFKITRVDDAALGRPS